MRRALFALGVLASLIVLASGRTSAQQVPSGALAPPVIVTPASAVNGAGAILIGSGGASSTVGGTLFTSTTATSTTDLLEDTLLSYTLPANTLAVNGRGVRITAWGSFAANANTKTLKVYFGGTLFATSSSAAAAPNGINWHSVTEVWRTGAATQVAITAGILGQIIVTPNATPTETLSGTVLIKVTGTGPTTIGDITANSLMVEAI